MSKNNNTLKHNCMVAFIFDSGKYETSSYGEATIEVILKGEELKKNQSKIIISVGDVFDDVIYIDISPYVISDELCSINLNVGGNSKLSNSEQEFKVHDSLRDYPYVVVMEDIEKDLVHEIDIRLHKECAAYLGVTSIDIQSVDQRKQFWKKMIRLFSLEGDICTVFGEKEQGFVYEYQMVEAGYKVHYDGFCDDLETDNRTLLFSTRQSSFIHSLEQLKVIEGKNDSDRNLIKMNFALVKEVEIAGVEIWKAIEDISRVHITKDCKYTPVDYIFTSFYQAAQGIERLLKILVELVVYIDNNADKYKTDKLLHSHNHIALADYLTKKEVLKFDTSCRNLLQILTRFYNVARYDRYVDSADDKLEFSLLNEFGKPLKDENFDDEFKKMYGKILGKISRIGYRAINDLSFKLGIYVYELNSSSVACIVFWDSYQENLYKSLLELENAKKEIIWYLICNGNRIVNKYTKINIPSLSFDGLRINSFISAMVKGNLCETDIESFIDEEYNELRIQDKSMVKSRLGFLDYLFSDDGFNDHFLDDDLDY